MDHSQKRASHTVYVCQSITCYLPCKYMSRHVQIFLKLCPNDSTLKSIKQRLEKEAWVSTLQAWWNPILSVNWKLFRITQQNYSQKSTSKPAGKDRYIHPVAGRVLCKCIWNTSIQFKSQITNRLEICSLTKINSISN